MSNPIESLEPRVWYTRFEDMSPDGRIRIIIEDDGDVILTVIEGDVNGSSKEFKMASAQFCTYVGGGRSPKVRLALLSLARAIKEENAENPQPKQE